MQERNVAVEEVVHTRGSCRDHILGDLNTAVVSPHTFSVFCSGHCSSVTITAEQFEDRNRVIWMKAAPACGSVRKRGKKERRRKENYLITFNIPPRGESQLVKICLLHSLFLFLLLATVFFSCLLFLSRPLYRR